MADATTNVEDIYPLSPMQEGMLFHALLDESSGAYLEQLSLRVVGALNVDALERAWKLVMDRHAVLRTSFHWQGLKRPMQRVSKRVSFAIGRRSLRGVPDRDRALAELREEERRRRFSLASAPLQRVSVIDLGDD